MPRMHILTPTEYAAFETPPVFSSVERKRFFDLSQRLEDLLTRCATPTNRICFVWHLGYFGDQTVLCPPVPAADADYVARQLGFARMFNPVTTKKRLPGGTAS